MWDLCVVCNKPKVCKSNLIKLRWLIAGGTTGGLVLGGLMLPLLGFGIGGIAAGSAAAAWQSSIGIVTAGSFFAILQSLGATGLGILLFGGIGSALGLLGTLAAALNWCTCDKTDKTDKTYNTINKDNTNDNKIEGIAEPD